MKTAAVIFGLTLTLAVTSFSQVRTVTNSTLSKFQQKRLAAERDYRENYARMGFPSPEELDRQREADSTARLQLADQLRQARLEKERLELERRSLDLESARVEAELTEPDQVIGSYGTYFGGFGGVGGFGSRHRTGRFRRHSFGRDGYRVTPFGVIRVPNPRPARILLRGGRRR